MRRVLYGLAFVWAGLGVFGGWVALLTAFSIWRATSTTWVWSFLVSP